MNDCACTSVVATLEMDDVLLAREVILEWKSKRKTA